MSQDKTGRVVSASQPRDLRLDFFRGLAMFIILLAHTPGNTWTLWIPARFGFSDATEIFVFCSGMASAIAFGKVFRDQSWALGTARISFRVWQVYWAHIGIFLATALMLTTIDQTGIGLEGKRYITSPYIVPFFTKTEEALVGLMTLTYVPGLFDILPMYLVILAMIPLVMALSRFGGRTAVFGFMLTSWTLVNLAGYARETADVADPNWYQSLLSAMGEPFLWMNLPSYPWGNGTWFFNPFAWQVIFFTGFAFGMRWLPAPPVTRRLIILAATVVLVTIPFAWFKIHRGLYLPDEWLLHDWIFEIRDFTSPLWSKTWQGIFRYTHFLALAYLAWVAVGPRGIRLNEGFTAPRVARPAVLWGAAIVLLLTAPYAYVDEIKFLSPALDQALISVVPVVDGDRIGLLQIAHLVALILLVWAAMGDKLRNWIVRDAFLKVVPVIRKVGTQSLAVFMVSIVLSRFNGFLMDVIGRDVWTRAAINLWGFAVLIAVAYSVSWFKSQPWRVRRTGATPASGSSTSGNAGEQRLDAPQGAVKA